MEKALKPGTAQSVEQGKRDYPECEAQICEALVREINRARRWSAVIEAWNALTHVRHMAGNMRQESNKDAVAEHDDSARP